MPQRSAAGSAQQQLGEDDGEIPLERRPDGVVIRGAKTSVTGSPFVDEQIVMPTKNMPEAEAEYAVACAVPAAHRR